MSQFSHLIGREREGGREGEREGGREGGREREGEREGGREGKERREKCDLIKIANTD